MNDTVYFPSVGQSDLFFVLRGQRTADYFKEERLICFFQCVIKLLLLLVATHVIDFARWALIRRLHYIIVTRLLF